MHGYLLQGCSIEELATGVSVLASGGRYSCLEVAQRIADSLTHEHLTPRETDVLGLLALGQSNKSIARQLDITVGTVKGHLRTIFNKLQAASRTEAVGIATRRGLIGEPVWSPPVLVHSRPALPMSNQVRTGAMLKLAAPSEAARPSGTVPVGGTISGRALELVRDGLEQLVSRRELDLLAGHEVLDATREGGGCRVGPQLQHEGTAVRVLGFGLEGHG